MKVFDLQCSYKHVFEGWFASEDDFTGQRDRGLIECPICGDAAVFKRLSAPHLSLGSSAESASTGQIGAATGVEPSLQAAWMAVARRVLANTEDVGDKFAEEARRIHYGEAVERGIRGQASRGETQALIDEGISVLPLALPVALRGKLQ